MLKYTTEDGATFNIYERDDFEKAKEAKAYKMLWVNMATASKLLDIDEPLRQDQITKYYRAIAVAMTTVALNGPIIYKKLKAYYQKKAEAGEVAFEDRLKGADRKLAMLQSIRADTGRLQNLSKAHEVLLDKQQAIKHYGDGLTKSSALKTFKNKMENYLTGITSTGELPNLDAVTTAFVLAVEEDEV